MITNIPLPSWRELAAFFLGQVPNDDDLARPWRPGKERAFWFSRAAWVLKVLVVWWEKTTGKKAPVLWLPDYFCNQSTLPVRDAGARLVFYPVGRDLEPKWIACQTLAAAEKPDLFVLVHYFGKPAGGAQARLCCDDVSAVLIEDAAHVLSPTDGIGSHGDFTFYSPYKLFPISDGAVLLVQDNTVADEVARALSTLPVQAPSPWEWLIKKILQKFLPAVLLDKRAQARRPAFNDDPPLTPLLHTPQLSRVARRMLADQSRHIDKIATARKSHAEAIRTQIGSSATGYPLLRSTEEGAAPYRMPVLYNDQNRARNIYNFLSKKGCPVETWPDLPPEVLAQPDFHAEAIRLRCTVVFLPTHQSATLDQLSECCSADELT